MATSKITLGDGSTVEMTRREGLPDDLWNNVIKFVRDNEQVVKKNPAIVKFLSEYPDQVQILNKFTNDADAIKSFLESQLIAQHIAQDSEQDKMKALAEDPELKQMFEEIKANPDALMKYMQNEALMQKVSQKLGGLGGDLVAKLKTIQGTSVTLHEAARQGDLERVHEFLKNGKDVDSPDFKGVTALGYAVGHDKLPVVKVLLAAKANGNKVDSAGNTAVHFAAGYGRVQILEHLIASGAAIGGVNAQGMTPLAAAQQNKQAACVTVLQRNGAK